MARKPAKFIFVTLWKSNEKAFGRIQDNLFVYPNSLQFSSLHFSIVHYNTKVCPIKALDKKLNAKHWLPGENFLRRKVFILWVAWSNSGNPDQQFIQKSNLNALKKIKVILRPNLEVFRGVWGFMITWKMKADTKLTVVMWGRIFD